LALTTDLLRPEPFVEQELAIALGRLSTCPVGAYPSALCIRIDTAFVSSVEENTRGLVDMSSPRR
jgi:hypothetical protein